MDYLPIFLNLRGAAVAVVGGGPVGARKTRLLLQAGAQVRLIAPQLCPELFELAALGRITHVAEWFRREHLHGVTIAVGATGDRPTNALIASAARETGIPVNIVDDAELSSFIFPAIVDRSPLIVALGSGGQAPVLARWLRARVEALLPARLGNLARLMGTWRAAVRAVLAPAARRAFWERIVDGPVGTRVLAGDDSGAAVAFGRELEAARLVHGTQRPALGEVYLIGAGPGDPDLLTLRALQLLQRADVVLYDRLVGPEVLDRARRDAERIFVGKAAGEHASQANIHELLVHYASQGRKVARLKGGDPFIFGRGGEELEVLAAHGIPCVVVPGITAALGAAASAGIPLTHRGLARGVTFLTGHDLSDEGNDWPALARAGHTLVFYMGVAQLTTIVAKLRAAGADAERPAALIERATLPEQRVLQGSLSTIGELARETHIAPPALLIVGDVARFAAAEILPLVPRRSTVAVA